MSLTQDLLLGITTTTGLEMKDAGSYAYSFASAFATNSVTDLGPFSKDKTNFAPGTAAVTIPGEGVWIGTTAASTTVDGSKSMSSNMSGFTQGPFGSLFAKHFQ